MKIYIIEYTSKKTNKQMIKYVFYHKIYYEELHGNTLHIKMDNSNIKYFNIYYFYEKEINYGRLFKLLNNERYLPIGFTITKIFN